MQVRRDVKKMKAKPLISFIKLNWLIASGDIKSVGKVI